MWLGDIHSKAPSHCDSKDSEEKVYEEIPSLDPFLMHSYLPPYCTTTLPPGKWCLVLCLVFIDIKSRLEIFCLDSMQTDISIDLKHFILSSVVETGLTGLKPSDFPSGNDYDIVCCYQHHWLPYFL